MVSKNQIKYVRQLEMKKYRKREGVFVAEGPKVVGDLLASGFRARMLFATSEWAGDACAVSAEELQRLSFLQHPQQVVGVFELPEPVCPTPRADTLALALDGVQDPGNLGTIIRIADWFGIKTVYCSADTADAWSPKVVQATMGSIARVNIVYTELAPLLANAQVPVYGTLLDGQNIYEQTLSRGGIIVMGNEGNGISPAIRQHISHKLLIPHYNTGGATHAESLNVAVATAITCAEFRRQFRG